MSKTILETERLILREINHEDLEDLLQIWGDEEAMRLFPKTLDREEMAAWIDRNLTRYEQTGHGILAVILKSEGTFIGDCGLVIQDVDGVEELEVGYHFNKKYWGQGLAAEAARGCMAFAFDRLNRRRIISMIRPENLSSRRVAERNGLKIEKEIFWRGYQHYVYVTTLRPG
jgi:ribosomal-protein-alanine N-acetyltransferase